MIDSLGDVEEIGSFGKRSKIIKCQITAETLNNAGSFFQRAVYRNEGDGKPCAGHNMENAFPFFTTIGLVSIEDNFGGVDEIGSKLKEIRH